LGERETFVKETRRVDAREGYDLWAETYDETPNAVVAMDARYTLDVLAPKPGERILDAGCGTGRHLGPLLRARSNPVGVDFSRGMLEIARRNYPDVPLALSDLQQSLPFEDERFDAVLCALIGEHLNELPFALREMHRVLRANGRLVFSVYHPEMAAAGKEANFERSGVEYRLGAHRYTIEDYENLLEGACFEDPARHEFLGDERLVRSVPSATKLLGFPVLLVFEARKKS
jgi:ubiquinone/menaquinone biosynthesis C-methylase UbiE